MNLMTESYNYFVGSYEGFIEDCGELLIRGHTKKRQEAVNLPQLF